MPQTVCNSQHSYDVKKNEIPQSVTSQERHEAPNLEPGDVIMCCLVRVIAHLREQ
jgi:hypothetical protein